MAGLEARVRRGNEGEFEKVSVQRHIAEAPLLTLKNQLSDYHSFRARPRERVSIDDAIETLRAQSKRFCWHFHTKPTLEEQRHVIHALADARDIAHVHDSAPKLIEKLDDVEIEIKAKKLDKEVESERLKVLDAMRKYVLLDVHPAEKKATEWAIFTTEELISQAKREKKMDLVTNLQTLIASLLLAQKYYVVTLKQYVVIKEEIDRVAQRLAYDEIIKESKKRSS